VILLYGVGETVYDSAIRAVLPSIIPKAALSTANGRIEAAESVIQNFLAGPLTSLLFAVTVLIPLGANAAAFALAAVLALALPAVASGRQFAAPADAPRERWYRQLGDGYRFIFGSRMLTTLLFLSTFVGLMFSAATATFILFLVDDQGLPEEFFGLFMLSGAVGGILGSLVAGRLSARFGTGPTMAVANLVASAPIVVLWIWPNLWVAAAMNLVTAVGVLVWNVLVMSLRQSIIPGRLLGRVHGSLRTILWGSMPVGSLLGGLLARVDITLPFLVGGGLATLAGLVFFRFLSRLPNPEDVDNGDPPSGGSVAEPGPTDPATRD
jgi:predicted MFS family arabinose efflux permease